MSAKKETTHIISQGELIVYRRERSSIWQCRFKVGGIWQRASTKQRKLADAIAEAKELRITAEIRKRNNLPVVTRKFRHVAKLAMDRLQTLLDSGQGKVSYKDYIRITNEYLIPILGNRLINSIDHAALEYLEQRRTELMGHAPSKSTLLSQNAALNCIFDEAIQRNFITELNRPKLSSKGNKSVRHPAFELEEIQAVLKNFDAWIARARNEVSRESRMIMRDYVEILLDTGARPGRELLNLKWKQISYTVDPTFRHTGIIEKGVDGLDDEEVLEMDMQQIVEMPVTGKTGTRKIIGRKPTVEALKRIAQRNYAVETPLLYPLKNVATPRNDDYVLRTRDDKRDVSAAFQKMLEVYLRDHNLLFDPKSDTNRVFYSFRHTYATLALTYDKVPIHTLAKQMGTSVPMIEKHYSHLEVLKAVEQLSGVESRKRIANTSTISKIYAFNGRANSKPQAKPANT